jgi:hypothetical protein
VSTYASEFAEWKQEQREAELQQGRAGEAVDEEEVEEVDDRKISTDSVDYEDVPASRAYITVKTTKKNDIPYKYYHL